MTIEVETDLFLRAKQGDTVALLALYEGTKKPWYVGASYFKGDFRTMSKDDWIAEGDVKFFETWNRWDPEGDAKFSTYMETVIKRRWYDISDKLKRFKDVIKGDSDIMNWDVSTFHYSADNKVETVRSFKEKLDSSKGANLPEASILFDIILEEGSKRGIMYYAHKLKWTREKTGAAMKKLISEFKQYLNSDKTAFIVGNGTDNFTLGKKNATV